MNINEEFFFRHSLSKFQYQGYSDGFLSTFREAAVVCCLYVHLSLHKSHMSIQTETQSLPNWPKPSFYMLLKQILTNGLTNLQMSHLLKSPITRGVRNWVKLHILIYLSFLYKCQIKEGFLTSWGVNSNKKLQRQNHRLTMGIFSLPQEACSVADMF